ncbi:hypothetical protein ApDm4_2506 [Acetobacter pomorum]|nr:hypothetical protein ApDm4_2506 [Acetobacter pomorum]
MGRNISGVGGRHELSFPHRPCLKLPSAYRLSRGALSGASLQDEPEHR